LSPLQGFPPARLLPFIIFWFYAARTAAEDWGSILTSAAAAVVAYYYCYGMGVYCCFYDPFLLGIYFSGCFFFPWEAPIVLISTGFIKK